LDCPVCKNEPTIVLELNEIEIDYCLSCNGIWLDTGELELLLEDNTETKIFLNSFTLDNKTKEKKLRCPICNKKMDKVQVVGGKEIRIDKCKYNHGLWFDSGELEDVLEIGMLDKQNIIPSSCIHDIKDIKIRTAKASAQTKTTKTSTRDLGDLMRAVNNYMFITCNCGLKMKLPPNIKKSKINCPRCGKENLVPIAELAAIQCSIWALKNVMLNQKIKLLKMILLFIIEKVKDGNLLAANAEVLNNFHLLLINLILCVTYVEKKLL